MKKKTPKKRRQKGSGTLILRGQIWHARWTHNGITHMESTGVRIGDKRKTADGKVINDRELAEEFLLDKTEPFRIRHREDAIALLVRQLQTPEERLSDDIAKTEAVPTVGDLARMFEESTRRPDCSDEMMTFYKRIIGNLAKNVGPHRPVVEITDEVSGEYAREIRQRGAASGTYNKILNALTLVWKVCGRECGIADEDNPWRGITRKKSDTHVRGCFKDAEADLILKKAQGEMRTLFAVGLYTGLRLGDAVNLRYEDFKDGEVFVKTHKTGAHVAIPAHPRLAEIVGDTNRTGFLMPNLAAMYADKKKRTHITRMTRRVIEECGMTASYKVKGQRARPDLGFHSCRVFFVSKALAAGVPLAIVQGIVGHTTVAMTEHYFRVDSDSALEAFRKMK